MARTQKNKATMGHLGLLKARLAKLRRELIEPKGGGGASGEGFDVAKTGDARIGFVGQYSVILSFQLYFCIFLLQQSQEVHLGEINWLGKHKQKLNVVVVIMVVIVVVVVKNLNL